MAEAIAASGADGPALPVPRSMVYSRPDHAARSTGEFVFNQLIPYIGNKRKLLGLIRSAVQATGVDPATGVFLDAFAGSGVVSRWAKRLGFRVLANDWEPYSRPLLEAAIGCDREPGFRQLGGYAAAIEHLNGLPPRIDWVSQHLSPEDDARYDTRVERMFYMRKNAMRIDAIRHQIECWQHDGRIDEAERACLLAPLLYQACYTSNTSGVFKGFHNGWGGRTGTALYRIASDLRLAPAIFHENGRENAVFTADAQKLAEELAARRETPDIAYIDPPYNQHPYGSNYHVLNSITLWDKPALTRKIEGRNKAAIRLDWRAARRSAYNHTGPALAAYESLLATLRARFILTSYSTDGTIPLHDLLRANAARGGVRIVSSSYKRYRVSPTRPSAKPVNVEFVVITDTARRGELADVAALAEQLLRAESRSMEVHPEGRASAAASAIS